MEGAREEGRKGERERGRERKVACCCDYSFYTSHLCSSKIFTENQGNKRKYNKFVIIKCEEKYKFEFPVDVLKS